MENQYNRNQFDNKQYEREPYMDNRFEHNQYSMNQYEQNQYMDNRYDCNQYNYNQYADNQHMNNQHTDNQHTDNQHMDNQHMDNRFERNQYNCNQYMDNQYDNSHNEDRPRTDSRDEAYFVEEISRIKQETEKLRQVLNDRMSQVDKMQETIDRCNVDSNALVKKIAAEIDKLSDRIEEMEDAITDSLERNSNPKPFEEQCKKLSDDFEDKIEGIKRDINMSTEMSIGTKNLVAAMDEKLDNKTEKKAILSIHNRLSTMFAIGVADLAGTVMTLIILCYLIMSLSR